MPSSRIATTTSKVVVTPTIATAVYAAGRRLGTIQTLDAACSDIGHAATLLTVSVLDKSKQKQPLTIFLFDSLPTVASADNTALDISAVEMQKCIGAVAIAATDYADVLTASIATLRASSTGLLTHSLTTNGALYAVVAIGGAGTYATSSDLVFTYKFVQDF